MTGSTWESSPGAGGPRDRSDSSEPWDERNVAAASIPTTNTANNTTSTSINNSASRTMRRDPYSSSNNKYDEEELEDGDLPRLDISRSTSNGNDVNRVGGGNTSTNSIHYDNLRKMAGGDAELRKQQAFWKQLDSPTSTMTNEDNEATAVPGTASRRKRRFDKENLSGEPNTKNGAVSQFEAASARDRPLSTAPVQEVREDNRSNKKNGKVDPISSVRRAHSEDSDDTRDSKEYEDGENEDANFCDPLSAMEAICGDAGLQAFCGGGTTIITAKSIGDPHPGPENRRKRAKNLNILNARDDNDSVDEHTAIEVEYVEPEETTGMAQERPENWSPTRKNAYLAAMARKAKEDFEKSQAKEIAVATPINKRKPPPGAPSSPDAAQDVYNSFNAAEKRKFLRLINSGMTPTESAERVHAEREKSKETRPSKKGGKLFGKFWKKNKSKNTVDSAPTENEKEAPMMEGDGEGFPAQKSYPQEEKKEDDRQLLLSDPTSGQQKETTSESASTSGDITGGAESQESPSQSQSQSQSHSSYDDNHEENHRDDHGSDTSSTPPSKESTNQRNQLEEGTPEERSSNSGQSVEKPLYGSYLPPERPMIDKTQDPASLNPDATDGTSSFDDRFAKSGINYYDAVRRDLSESEDETELSNQVSVSSKNRSARGPRLGPILQSPKLQGFSKLTKGGSKDRAKDKYASTTKGLQEWQLQESQKSTPSHTQTGPDKRQIDKEWPSPAGDKTEVDPMVNNHNRDFMFTENVNEYGTTNFDAPVRPRSSAESLNSTSKAEEEALERIEKELLRPVRNISSSTSQVRSGVVSPESSGRGSTTRTQKSAERLRDQIVAVVSPGSSQAVTPVTPNFAISLPSKEITPTKESTPAAESLATTAVLTPMSTHASHANNPHAPPSENLPSPAKLSPLLASAVTTPPSTSQAKASHAISMEPTQEDLDLEMQQYLNSTEAYSQGGQVSINDSMSVVSGRSFTTTDTGAQGGSVYTQGSTLTQSSRKRRPGAAKTRLAKAKEAQKQGQKKKGWHESIRAVAESTNRIWKPKVGWVDYAEQSMDSNTTDLSMSMTSTEKMHLNLSVDKSSKHTEENAPGGDSDESGGDQGQQDLISIPQSEQEIEVDRNVASVPAPLLPVDHEGEHEMSTQKLVRLNNQASLENPDDHDSSPHWHSPQFLPASQEEQTASNLPGTNPLLPDTNFGGIGRTVPHQVDAHVRDGEGRPENILEPIDSKQEALGEKVAHLSVDTSYPSLDESPQQQKVGHMSVDTSFPGLEDSYLDVPPAPESDYPTSSDTLSPENNISLSLDNMSLDESIAHSVDQFVMSVGAASPPRSGRKKTSSSPNRSQRFATSPTKKSGWVDSMRAATANIGKEQSWDPMTGWAVTESELARSPLNEDFALPSTRFEQETIEERQTEVSEAETDTLKPIHEEITSTDAMESSAMQFNESEAEKADSFTHTNRLDKPPRPLYGHVVGFSDSPAQSPVEVGKGKRATRETEGGFSTGNRINVTPTVDVVKEKVDEEDYNWFPRSRRSSSMVVIDESPEEQVGPSTHSSVASASLNSMSMSPGRNLGQGHIQLEKVAEESGREGVVWDGVVFETGVATGTTSTFARAESSKASQSEPVGANNDSKADASKSGSSISTKSSYSRIVPKLSQSKRDTSPIRAKSRPNNFRQDEPDDLMPLDAALQSRQGNFENMDSSDVALSVSSASRLDSSHADNQNPGTYDPAAAAIAQIEQARASRSVWRNAKSPASASVSPAASPTRGNFPTSRQYGHASSMESPVRPDSVGWPDEEEEEEAGMDGEDRYFSTEDGAFPSAMDPPSSPGSTSSSVRQRAQQWESRTPRDNVGREAEQRHPPSSSGRLNSATAEWKSFLGKKVRAESAAAAEQKGGQRLGHNYGGGQNDSLFDFSVTESVDSRVRSPVRSGPQGQHNMTETYQQEDSPGRHQKQGMPPSHRAARYDEDVDISNADTHAPTEISEHSDGSEINKPFLARIAGCAAPMMRKGSQQGQEALAHLAFLRTNPDEGKHSNSRFMPQYLCGRPDVIHEEAHEAENDGEDVDDPVEEKKVVERDERSARADNPEPRGAPQVTNVNTAVNEVRAETRSVISEDFGAKTAYLEALAVKTAVSKPRRSDSRRRERSSTGSDISSASSKLQQKERWREFLERKSKTGASPGKARDMRTGSDTTASAAEHYAAKKVEEMMAMMASRSKSTPRNFRSPDDPDTTNNSRFVENAIREHNNENCQRQRNDHDVHYRSDSLVAAEQLASARVNAMMQALAQNENSVSMMEEGEI